MTWALLTMGTVSKYRFALPEGPKLSRVLPTGSLASTRCRSMRRRSRSAISCSPRATRKRAAGQPSLSAWSANRDHSSLIAGRRSSVSISSRRAASTGSSCGISHELDGAQFVILGQRRQRDGDVRNAGGIGGEAGFQGPEIGQPASREILVERLGEVGLAAPLVAQRQQADHGLAGLAVGLCREQRLEGAGIGGAGEELVAVDEVKQRHGLVLQGMDDVAIVDHMAV